MSFALTTIGILAAVSGARFGHASSPIHAKVNKCCPPDRYWNETTRMCVKYVALPKSLNSTHWTVPKQFVHQDDVIHLEWQQHSSSPICPFNNSETKYLRINGSSNESESSTFLFTHHGVLLEIQENNLNTSNTLNYQVEHYCIDPTPEGIVIQICPSVCGDHEPCLRKCCPLGQHLSLHDHENPKCVPSNNPSSITSFPHNRWHLPLYNNSPAQLFPLARNLTVAPRFHSRFTFHCGDNLLQASSGWKSSLTKEPFRVLTDGNLASLNFEMKQWVILNVTDYCYDLGESHDEEVACVGEPEVLYYCVHPYDDYDEYYENDTDMDSNVEGPELEPGEHLNRSTTGKNGNEGSAFLKFWNTTADIMLGIATVLLGFTAVILLLIVQPGNIHDWTRLSFVTSEWVLLIMCMIARFSAVGDRSPKSCAAIAIIFHYSGLVTVSWISVLNFDLWWTFRVLQTSVSTTKKLQRFACYTVFALGLPLLILLTSIVIESQRPISRIAHGLPNVCHLDPAIMAELTQASSTVQSNIVYPRYGEAGRCSLASESLAVYWYGPLCFLLLLNLLFFLSTTARLVNLRKATRRASVVSTHGSRVSREVFIKIFFMAGITWNSELIGWICGWSEYRTDIVQYIQAVGLFIIFVVQREALRKLQKKYPIFEKIIPLPVDSGVRKTSTFSERKNSSSIGVSRKCSADNGQSRAVSFKNKPLTHDYPTQSIEFISISSNSNNE